MYSQGYERVRHSSEEELFLLRTHDMEEGSSHSELSSSGEQHTEEVSYCTPAKSWQNQ